MLRALLVSVTLLAAVACGSDDDEIARSGLPISTTTSAEAPDNGENGEGQGEGEGSESGEGSLEIRSPDPDETIQGNVVALQLTATGISIVAADGDRSGNTGHYHVFIDRDPVPVGEVIPRAPDIIHTTEDTIVVPGLTVGEHRLVVTIGDGTHARVSDELTAEITLDVEGPALEANAPTTIQSGEEVTVDVTLDGITLGGENDPHLHYIVSDDLPPQREPIPQDEEGIIHSSETSVSIPGLEPGEHTIWVVLGDADHVPWSPPVVDRLTVTVE